MHYTVGAERILTEDGWRSNQVISIQNGRIVQVANGKAADYWFEIITPGLIDSHIHGGAGFDIMNATKEDLKKWLLSLARAGIGAVLPTPYTAPFQKIHQSLAVIYEVMQEQSKGTVQGARILGVHLEGPFISQARLGAMEASLVVSPSLTAYQDLVAEFASIISQLTLAPEIPGAMELAGYLHSQGVKVLLGHSDASYDQATAAFAAGIEGVCHFYNAARPIHHREPGFLTAALLNDKVYAEIIADLVHVHPAAIKLLHHMLGSRRMILVSDAVSTTNLPDGHYIDNGIPIEVKGGASYTQDGSLNGGGTYLPGAIRNLVTIGFPFADAVQMASSNVRRWLQSELGLCFKGAPAFLLGWENLQPKLNVIADQLVWRDCR